MGSLRRTCAGQQVQGWDGSKYGGGGQRLWWGTMGRQQLAHARFQQASNAPREVMLSGIMAAKAACRSSRRAAASSSAEERDANADGQSSTHGIMGYQDKRATLSRR